MIYNYYLFVKQMDSSFLLFFMHDNGLYAPDHAKKSKNWFF